MKKEEFLKKKKELKPELKDIFVEVEEKLSSSYTIGCCYDQENRKWKVYRKRLPDRSNVCEFYIFLETDSEDEAFNKLYYLMMKEIEREEADERERQLRIKKRDEEESKLPKEEQERLREERAVNAKKTKMEQVFFCNGFTWDRIGEKMEIYLIRKNMYCKLKYIKEKRAFVILSADNKEDVLNEVLKQDPNYYYMDEPEKEMVERLRANVKQNYKK